MRFVCTLLFILPGIGLFAQNSGNMLTGTKPDSVQGPFNADLNRGIAYLTAAKYDSALVAYTKALEIQPTSNAAYYGRGMCFFKKNNYPDAISNFSFALQYKPGLREALLQRAVCYQNIRDYTAAIADYDRIITPDSGPGLYNDLGFCYQKQGNNELAIIQFSMAISKAPTVSSYYYSRGISYLATGNSNAAIRDLSVSIQNDKKNKLAYFERGVCYDATSQFSDAIADYTAAIEIDSAYVNAFRNRGADYYHEAAYNEAAIDFAKSISLQPNYISYFNRGLSYFNLNQFDLALSDFTESLKLRPTDPESFFERGLCYKKINKYSLAIESFSTAINLKRIYPEAYFGRASCNKLLGKCDSALVDYNQAISFRPNYNEAIDEKEDCLKLTTEKVKLKKTDTVEIDLSNKTTSFFAERGTRYETMGNYNAAIRDYTEAIKLNPKNVIALKKRAMVYKRTRDENKAIIDFSNIIKLKTNDTSVFYNRGSLYEDKGDFDDAIIDYTQAIELDANYANAYYQRGKLFYKENNLGAAIQDLNTCIKLAPNNPNIWFNRGLVYFELGNYPAAIDDFNETLKYRTNDQLIVFQKLCYLAIDKYAASKALPLTSANTGTFFDDKFYLFLNKYVDICENDLAANDYKTALVDFSHLLKDYPVVSRFKKMSALVFYSDRDISITYAHALVKIGWTFEQSGDFLKAMEFYQKAFVIDSNAQNVNRKIQNLQIKRKYSTAVDASKIELIVPKPGTYAKISPDGTIFVAGTATDPSGIESVSINDIDTKFTTNGLFQLNLPEEVNDIKIVVTNGRGHPTKTVFHIANKIKLSNAADTIPDIPPQERFKAILIACGDYEGERWSKLTTTVSEAEALKKVLVDKYNFANDDIETIYNENRRDILTILSKELQNLNENDNLLIFFSGHGFIEEVNNNTTAYWVPLQAENRADYISNSDINNLIAGTNAKHILVMADACYSGAFRSDDSTPNRYEYNFMSRQLLSSGGTERVPGRSVFIPMVITALNNNKYPYLSARLLYGLIFNGVRDQTGNEPTLRDLQVQGSQGGQFYFKRLVE